VEFRVVIPARYASTRLPGKPLLDIGGLPMIQRVVERACASAATEVLVATDDERIAARGAPPAQPRRADSGAH
jgi:3-deoxy-manno-octulosonate cytidylyltransferase (CMP-KDO synthetase)